MFENLKKKIIKLKYKKKKIKDKKIYVKLIREKPNKDGTKR